MKNLTIILILISFSAFAQKSDSTKKQLGLIVKADVLVPIISHLSKLNEFSLTVEKLFKQRHSLQLTYVKSWYNKNTFVHNPATESGTDKNSTYQIIPEYKFFISKKKAHTGYYIGAYAKFISTYEKSISSITSPIIRSDIFEYSMYSISEGVINGFQFYFFNHLTLDVLLGIGVREVIEFNQIQGNFGGNSSALFDLRAAINIGYKF